MAKVSQAIHHFQILRTIIGPVPVDVMDDLSVEQPATEDALHDDAMHISLSFSVHHGAVSVGHCPFTPLPFWVAFACESSIAEGKVPACHGAEVSILAGRRLAALFAIHAARIARTFARTDLSTVVAHRLATLQRWGYLRGVA